MSEYKRLTAHKLTSFYDWERENLKPEQIAEMYDRLAELEDKIEDGTLVELPCKVGDTVYFIEYFCNANGCSNDKQTICCGCSEMLERERKKQTYVISEKKFRLKDLSKINKTLYITKAEAEARLKELQEEQK